MIRISDFSSDFKFDNELSKIKFLLLENSFSIFFIILIDLLKCSGCGLSVKTKLLESNKFIISML
mgnify:CR=1 FL=1